MGNGKLMKEQKRKVMLTTNLVFQAQSLDMMTMRDCLMKVLLDVGHTFTSEIWVYHAVRLINIELKLTFLYHHTHKKKFSSDSINILIMVPLKVRFKMIISWKINLNKLIFRLVLKFFLILKRIWNKGLKKFSQVFKV